MPDPAPGPAPVPGASPPAAPAAPATITIQEFKRLDLRIGKIVAAEDHPNANKLYVLKVDIGGGEIRQIVAGIKDFYPREALPGKSVVVVCNLQTAKLRGLESQGMALAAATAAPPGAAGGGMVVLLAPEKEAPPGSRVS